MSYPSGIMKRLLKAPILFYRLGLGLVVGRLFMVMTTTGRKSGQPRRIAMFIFLVLPRFVGKNEQESVMFAG